MVAIIPPQTVLTQGDAAGQLQSDGLDVFGLTVPNLSPAWADAAPTGGYVASALTLQVTGLRVPFRAIRSFEASPTIWSNVSGAPIAGPIAVFRLHPEAARRLAQLVTTRHGAPLTRPVPVAMIVRGVTIPANPVLDWYRAGEQPLGTGAQTISFHDARGLPIDPIAVAALLRDLLAWQPALALTGGSPPAVNAPGGLDGIVALKSGVTCHVIDPHGWSYKATRDAAQLRLLSNSSQTVGNVTGGLVDIASGQSLGRAVNDDPSGGPMPLRWGNAVNGQLLRAPMSFPANPNLPCQFFRVMAVDLDWHLMGNRTMATVDSVPGDDGKVPSFAMPVVRPQVPNFDYLIDGLDVLGAAGQISAGFGGSNVYALAVSPGFDDGVTVPATAGAMAHWPQFPPLLAPTTTFNPLLATHDATRGLTARFRAASDGVDSNLDVIVSVAADVVPDGTHVRAYPRSFVVIDAIGEQPSFVRGDGGSGIAALGQATSILLVNPFALAQGAPLPPNAQLEVDLVVTSRTGQRRIHSRVLLAVNATTQPYSPAGPDGPAPLQQPAIAGIINGSGKRSIAPVPLFGLPRPAATGAPQSVLQLVRALASEQVPRQGPRLPTQARFETILALGAAVPGSVLAWQSILTGGRWMWETRCAQPELGDPGNPPGPDVHATGIRCDGLLAYDLALHAFKRAAPMLPMPGNTLGWVAESAGPNWAVPLPDSAGTVAAVMLETLAACCDTPELGLAPTITDGTTLANALNSVANLLGLPPPPSPTVPAEAMQRPRVQREQTTSKSGQRDALWSLSRVIRQARELLYIESPAFARTARTSGKPHEIDLVALIQAQLDANPRLKVAICVPRVPDFAPDKASWVRTALAHRKAALDSLLSGPRAARVAAFHPTGFPGRPTAIRSTVVIVDDAYCLAGTSHFRRRGMTFDGGVDVASIDQQIVDGYSAGVARFRHELMATRLGVPLAAGAANTSALWTRLRSPESAFDVLADLLSQGGLGRITPVWAGPTDTRVIPVADDLADPDGVDEGGSNLMALLASQLLER